MTARTERQTEPTTQINEAAPAARDFTVPPRIPLSAAHLNALSAHMKVVEESCRAIERNLDGFQGIYYESRREIPDESKREMRRALGELYAGLEDLKADLGLQKHDIDLPRWINAYLTHIWETLCESKSDSLKAFGSVPGGLRMYLDARMDHLLSILKRLQVTTESLLTQKSQDEVRK